MRLNKKNIIITCSCIFFGIAAFGFKTQQDLPKDTSITFEQGETLTYVAGYSVFEAGEAVVHLDKKFHEVNGKKCYKVDVHGKSIGMFGMGMKIRDLWQSYFDPETILPVQFNRDILEGGYTLEEKIDFDQVNGKAKVEWKKKDKPEIHNEEYEMAPGSFDVISGYYLLRTLDYEQYTKGDTITMNTFWENKGYSFDIVYLGVEKCHTKFGRIESYVMSPIMPENQLFSGTHPIKFWVSKDVNRIPLKIQAELIVGAVNVDLVRYKGLKQKLKKSKG
ncbi:DUF3108 domain-containing protein [Flammeovirga sp. SJP92]|uniref:DUF3108 domain-containing protein n=1 Tax=Flammeovirga sp. SJP92 TaxID=1775430 RepID=UPI0007873988|nr:DUF3108 domain-containing protein [Flammeovirga sp. SJP92]KXX71902.1 hypothetical protein AVL50_03715 [Flammeovirga sp. SJP92]